MSSSSKQEKHWTELRDQYVADQQARQRREKLKPLTPNHGRYLHLLDQTKATICVGPAGTGKTYMACGKAVQWVREGKIKRIVLTRPLVECDEETGFLPGDLWEKVVDIMRPVLDALDEFAEYRGEMDAWRRDGKLVIVPLAKMRGSTFKDSFIILDEAQNATFRQLRMFLTRFGRGSKMVLCGDHTQSDLPYKGQNSLWRVVECCRPQCHPQVGIMQMGKEDIVRDELVRWFDERLTGTGSTNLTLPAQQEEEAVPSYPPRDVPSTKYLNNQGWNSINCPSCKKTVWYEYWAEEGESLAGCFYCRQTIELCDASGRLDPQIIEVDPEEQGNHYETRDVLPFIQEVQP
jgi:hypothetical protein